MKCIREVEVASNPLEESLSALASVAMRDTGAEGFAYFRRDNRGALVRSMAFGTLIGEDAVSERGSEVTACFPLRRQGKMNGVLAFAFPSSKTCAAGHPRLSQFAAIIERVWVSQWLPDTYRQLLESIIGLEIELIDSKISIRVEGIRDGALGEDALDTIARHVETVLRTSTTLRILSGALQELQSEAHERECSEKAKSILQRDRGISEEEAHSYLRKLSRTSRKPFIEVAREVIQGKYRLQK